MNWNSKDGNEVHRQTIWAEHVRKELLHRCDKETFSIDPKNLRKNTLTEPVSHRPRRFLDKDAILLESFSRRLKGEPPLTNKFKETGPQLPPHLDSILTAVHKTPKDKYDFPQTEAQEMGWLNRPLLVHPQGSRFNHPRKTCEVTRYAAHIVASSNIDPFKKSKSP
jgi:hypothetical protein